MVFFIASIINLYINEILQCRSLISVEDKCQFVLKTEDCENGIGVINYLSFLYCNGDSVFGGGIFILVIKRDVAALLHQ
jgi:hypothetical protein